MFSGDTAVRNAYREATKSVEPHSAISLVKEYLEQHIDWYDSATAYWFGKMIERVGKANRHFKLDGNAVMTYVGQDNYLKGLEYWYAGKVGAIVSVGTVISSIVRGREPSPYETWVGFHEDGTIEDSGCTCPVRSNICKHVAALLCKAINDQALEPSSPTPLDDILSHL